MYWIFWRVNVTGELMGLTPPTIFGTNEVVCACSPPSVCMEGYNCSFFCGTLILLSGGVCVPCPLDGSWRRSPYFLAAEGNNTLSSRMEWHHLQFLMLRVTTITVQNLVALSMDSDENGVSTVGGSLAKVKRRQLAGEVIVAIHPGALPVLRTHLFQSNPFSVALECVQVTRQG